MKNKIVLERMDEFAALSRRLIAVAKAVRKLSLHAEALPRRVLELREELDFIRNHLIELRLSSYARGTPSIH